MSDALSPLARKHLKSIPRNAERMRYHCQHPEISFREHVTQRLNAHGQTVAKKTRIYLDVMFWGYFRDVVHGCPQRPAHMEILRLLSEQVASGKIICPISYPILAELWKHEGTQERKTVAQLVDQLSKGVVFRDPYDLMTMELTTFFCACTLGKENVLSVQEQAWSFAGYILGLVEQKISSADPNDSPLILALAKDFFDEMADIPFSCRVESMPPMDSTEEDELKEYAQKINENNAAFKHEVPTFELAFLAEIQGRLDGLELELHQALVVANRCRGLGEIPTFDSSEGRQMACAARDLIVAAYKHMKISTELPAIQVEAGLHAAHRHQQRKLVSNDIWDARHATMALGYCQVFFTEKALGNMLTQKSNHLEYDKLFGCRILWKEEDILVYLRSLADIPTNSATPAPGNAGHQSRPSESS